MRKDPATNPCMSFSAKPISLVERCYCRSTVSNLPRGYIRELRFIHTPNCPFQVMWVLRSTSVSDSPIESHVSTLAWNHQRGFLVIGHFSPSISTRWQGQRKELCAHSRPSVTFTHMVTEKVFISRPKVTFPGSESLEWEEKIWIFEIGFTHYADLTIWFKQSDLICSNN